LDVSIANDSFFIDIENTTNGIIERKEGVFRSTKPFPIKHGYGLRSVSKLVAKYDGSIVIEPNKLVNRFKVSISLPISGDRK
jgi:sensor histidine kinase regulating citrate/malate metabolism